MSTVTCRAEVTRIENLSYLEETEDLRLHIHNIGTSRWLANLGDTIYERIGRSQASK
jgi:hypothetical protein